MFKNKRVFITGGSKGLGRELALHIAKQGAEVLTVARTESQLESLQKEAESFGGKLSYIVSDLTNESALDNIIKWIYSGGGAEILIHNAGYLPKTKTPNSGFEDYKKAIMLNMVTPLYLTEEWLKNYKEGKRKPELVFFVNSISGLKSWDDVSPAYTSSKSGLAAGVQNMRLYFEKDMPDVRFVSIFPHTIDTAMTKNQPWTKMKKEVAIEAIIKMMEKETPYDSENIVLEIKEDGIYSGAMPLDKETQRVSYSNASWTKVAGKEKIIFPEGDENGQ